MATYSYTSKLVSNNSYSAVMPGLGWSTNIILHISDSKSSLPLARQDILLAVPADVGLYIIMLAGQAPNILVRAANGDTCTATIENINRPFTNNVIGNCNIHKTKWGLYKFDSEHAVIQDIYDGSGDIHRFRIYTKGGGTCRKSL